MEVSVASLLMSKAPPAAAQESMEPKEEPEAAMVSCMGTAVRMAAFSVLKRIACTIPYYISI